MSGSSSELNGSIDWTAARVFLAVARSCSLTAASRQLGISQPTISRHVRALERAVGARLFVRHARGIRPTERASELIPLAESVERAMEGFTRIAATVRQNISGSVRLAATEIVAVEVVAPRLAELRASYGEVAIELVVGNASSDLLGGDADLALRLYRPAQADLITRHIGATKVALFASQAYLARKGRPTTVASLTSHDLIGFDSRGPLARGMQAVHPSLTPERFAIRTDSLTTHLAAARTGAGLAPLQVPIARRYPELVAVPLDDLAPIDLPFWLTTHADLHRAVHVRVVWDWCERLLREYLA